MYIEKLKESDRGLKLNSQTLAFLDCISGLGYFLEVIDEKGYYTYISSNCTYDSTTAEELLGKHTTEAFDLTLESSILLNTLNTGKPYRNVHLKYKSAKKNKELSFLYHSFPITSNNIIIGAIAIYKYLDEVKRAIHYIDTANTIKVINTKAITQPRRDELFTFDDIICCSDQMAKTIKLAQRISKTDASVLIVGETGTGKELIAQSIHSFYKDKSQPFVAVNCAAIPETLLESILFGSTKGAYTDAVDKQGLFEEAHGGTIFLDELHTLSIEMQAKLLRVLETKTIRKVGGDKTIPVNVRVISAMNTNPIKAIKESKLKADLFYRIAVITIQIPPLSERGITDIKLLSNHFIKLMNNKLGLSIEGCSEATLNIFSNYKFPGNCRELSHIIEHSANMIDENERLIEPYHLPYYISESLSGGINTPSSPHPQLKPSQYEIGDYKIIHQKALNDFNDKFNTEYLTYVLKEFSGNISKAARAINVSRQHLHGLVTKYKIQA
ncbi:arginine utilization regulatory protein [Desulfuromusa kysingii]|uniref:Arginine utilization regulatory protein n=1 Tax=Desulfuromusa kysingii TaxID=37625 RepID=A0A1H4C763_9BACT|nr:sigma 54-interacting transcriptional regulator [Desulfuromusa kysingii]SEA56196.1 arginine utilization regulatory protein [Desulfuromusa kysingii]